VSDYLFTWSKITLCYHHLTVFDYRLTWPTCSTRSHFVTSLYSVWLLLYLICLLYKIILCTITSQCLTTFFTWSTRSHFVITTLQCSTTVLPDLLARQDHTSLSSLYSVWLLSYLVILYYKYAIRTKAHTVCLESVWILSYLLSLHQHIPHISTWSVWFSLQIRKK